MRRALPLLAAALLVLAAPAAAKPPTGEWLAGGLDYLAITDHNDIRSQSDPGFGTSGVIPVPGYENSLNGHAQMLGAQRIYDSGDKGIAAVTAMAAALRGDG